MSAVNLASLKSDVKKRKSHRVWYGPPGAGKTSLLAQSRNSAFIAIAGDRGIEDLKGHGLVNEDYPVYVVSEWSQLLGALEAWAKSPPYPVLNIDNLTEALALCRVYVMRNEFSNNEIEFNKYGGQGFRHVAAEWTKFLDLVDACRDAGVDVNSICHARSVKFQDPLVGDYDKWQPDLYDSVKADAPSILRPTIQRASDVFFLSFDTVVDSGKAKGEHNGRERRLYVERTATVEAKNRAKLKGYINLGDMGAEYAVQQLVAAYKAVKNV